MQGCEGTEILVRVLHRGERGPLSEYQGMAEVRSRDVVPGKTGRRASFEGRKVVYEVGNDFLHDLRGEPTRLARIDASVWIPAHKRTLEFGFGTVPNNIGEVFNSYDMSVAEGDGEGGAKRTAEYPRAKKWGSLEILRRGSLLTWMRVARTCQRQRSTLEYGNQLDHLTSHGGTSLHATERKQCLLQRSPTVPSTLSIKETAVTVLFPTPSVQD